MTKPADRDNESLDIPTDAYGWLARIETGDLSPTDRKALKEWMNRSPRHAAEIRAAAALSAELSCLTELLEPLVLDAKVQPRRRHFRIAMASIAVAVVALCVGIYALLSPVRTVHAFYATAVGQYSTKKLVDGSVIKLNTDSAVEVVYDRNAREVRLIQGEAYFEVAKNHSWPFIVYAGANSARAVGTAFSVSLSKSGTKLVVSRGVVAFSRLAPTTEKTNKKLGATYSKTDFRGHPVLVNAGYELSSQGPNVRETMQRLTPAEERRKLAWTEGLLDFSDTPLSEVVREVSRHTTMHIVIADPTLRNVKFGGVFPIGDIHTLLAALPRVGVVVQRVGKNEVLLYSKNNAPL